MPKSNVQERDLRSVSAVERAADVLSLICTSTADALSVKEIGEMTGLSVSTVHRLLTALMKKGLVEQDPVTRRYAMGRLMMDYCLGYLRNLDLPRVALPYINRLRDLTGETVSVSVLNGWSRVYVAQAESPQEIRQTLTLGQRTPLHVGGSGKAILAFLPDDVVQAYLAQPGLAPGAEGPVELGRLRADLLQIRQRGYATSAGERLPGAASVAAPVRNYLGEVIGCLSIGGPSWRFTAEQVARFGPAVVETATRISRDMGARV